MSTAYTKTSFKDAIVSLPTKNLEITLQDDYQTVDVKFNNVNGVDLKDNLGRYSYYGNYHNIALIDPDKLDYDSWEKEIKNIIDTGGSINDTDKVFFTKSALFPRASFNRYSTKARLVQTTKAATKFVFPNKFTSEISQSEIKHFTVIHTVDGKENEYVMGANLNDYFNLLGSLHRGKQTTEEKKALVSYNSLSNYQKYNMSLTDVTAALKSRLELEYGGLFEIAPKKFLVIKSRTLKGLQSFEFLKSGELELTDIVSDNVVNDYIDGFKDALDESTYDYLISTLSAHTSDPEVPMQLLTNMKIGPGNPRLDALFINLDQRAINNILSNRVMKTVDVKNFWETHSLQTIVDPYSHNNLQSKLSLIGKRAQLYETNESRSLLFTLIREKIEKSINDELGFEEGGRSYLKLKYESI